MTKPVLRKCQGCAKISDRNNFIKITLSEGKLHVNPPSDVLGRSVYVCKNINCVKMLIKKKRLYSGLKFRNFEEIEAACEKILSLVQ